LSQGPVAQLVEQGTFNPKVAGSRPARPTLNPLVGEPHSFPSRRWFMLALRASKVRRQTARRAQLYDPRMIHLRMVAPPALAERVLAVLEQNASVINVIHLPGAARRPSGDVILCDVAREDASVVLSELRELGLAEQGTIAIETIDTAISTAARAAERAAAGSPADAVVWEEVESRTSESAELSGSFLAFIVLATLIAGVGILTDSVILIIGAMVVGPEFGPLAGVCVALVHRRLALARRSLIALAVGFPVAIASTYVGTLLLRAADRGPDELADHPATLFISSPDLFSVIVAVLAGVAGVLSLSTAKSGALIGVLISVTTIPAAANVGVAGAYRDWAEFGGAAFQLGINLIAIVLAGVTTLGIQRAFYLRRRRAAFRPF
jgi:uncharacterized hydrophobic protein (TIGR00271 family)